MEISAYIGMMDGHVEANLPIESIRGESVPFVEEMG